MVSRKRDSKGFTLAEIIIVFILIGILAAAVIPTFTSMDDVGYETVQKGALGALRTAWAVAYYNNGNSAPTHTQVAALVTAPDGGACDCGGGVVTLIGCDEVLTTTGTSGTEAEFGISGAACASTISEPNAIVILGS